MGDDGDFAESFRSEDPESQGETELTEGGDTEDYESGVEPSRMNRAASKAPPKSGSSKWLVMCIIVILLAIAGVVSYFWMQKEQEAKDTTGLTERPFMRETLKPTVAPEAVSCSVGGLPPEDAFAYSVQADLGELWASQGKTPGSHAVFEMENRLNMPSMVSAEANDSFMAINLPFTKNNLTFFIIFDNCTRSSERIFLSDKAYGDIKEFRAHFSDIVSHSKRITSHKCYIDSLNPTRVPTKTVSVAAYLTKLRVDLISHMLTLEGCDDKEGRNCKHLYHEKVTLVPNIDKIPLVVTFHVGWNSFIQVGTMFRLDDYVTQAARCLLYSA